MRVYLKEAMNLENNGIKDQGKIMLHCSLNLEGKGGARQRIEYVEG